MTHIGHDLKMSATFLPTVVRFVDPRDPTGKSFIDFPGFLDNRGFEINIGNAMSSRAVVVAAETVKIVVLLSYGSIVNDRGRGLTDLLDTLQQMFGSEEQLLRHEASIVLGVTGYPRDEDLDDLQGLLTTEPCSAIVKQLAAGMFVYDPLNRPFDDGSGLTRTMLLDAICHRRPLPHPVAEVGVPPRADGR